MPPPDDVLELLLAHDGVQLDYDDCIGVTYDQVHEDPEGAIGEIVARFHAVEARCDRVLVIGSDYTDVGNPSELSFNARIAANHGESFGLGGECWMRFNLATPSARIHEAVARLRDAFKDLQ